MPETRSIPQSSFLVSLGALLSTAWLGWLAWEEPLLARLPQELGGWLAALLIAGGVLGFALGLRQSTPQSSLARPAEQVVLLLPLLIALGLQSAVGLTVLREDHWALLTLTALGAALLGWAAGAGQRGLAVLWALVWLGSNGYQNDTLAATGYLDAVLLIGGFWLLERWSAVASLAGNALGWLVTAWWLAVLGSGLGSVYVYSGWMSVLLTGRWCLLFLLVAALVRRGASLAALVGPFLAMNVAMSLLTLLEVAERLSVLGVQAGLGVRVWVLSTPPNYNVYTQILALPLLWGVARSLSPRWRWAMLPVAAVVCAAVLVSYSRVSYLAVGLGGMTLLGVSALSQLRRQSLSRLVAGGVAVLVISGLALGAFLAVAPLSVRTRFAEMLTPGSDKRWPIWRAAMPMLWDYPILGPGPQTKRQLMNHYGSKVGVSITEQYRKDAHNLYVEALTSMGFVGSAALLALLLGWGVVALRRAWQPGSGGPHPPAEVAAWGALAAGALVMVLVDGLANVRLWLPENGWAWYLYLGLLAGSAPVQPHRTRPPEPVRQGVRGLAALLLLAAAAATLREHLAQQALRQGQRAAMSGRPFPALRAFERAVRHSPLNAHAAYSLGYWNRQNGRPEQALHWFGRAVALSLSHSLYLRVYTEEKARNGQLKEALTLAEALYTLERVDDRALNEDLYGRMLYANGRREDALPHLFIALCADHRRGLTEPYQSDPALLYAVFDEVWLHPYSKDAYGNPMPFTFDFALRSAEQLGLEVVVDEIVTGATDLFPYNPYLPVVAARSHLRRYQFAEAEELLCQVEQLHGNSALIENERGMSAYLRGEYREAVLHFERGLALRVSVAQDSMLAVTMLAECAARLGNTEQARVWKERREYLLAGWEHQKWEANFHNNFDHELNQAVAWGL